MSKRSYQEILDELVFVLKGRRKSTFVVIGFDTYASRRQLQEDLKAELEELSFFDLDLTSVSVVSLDRELRSHVSREIRESEPGRWVVNITGLENSLIETHDGVSGPTALVSGLNFERENLFHAFPFTIILWTDRYMAGQLRQHARDLWSWVTYYFELGSVRTGDEVGEGPKAGRGLSLDLPEPSSTVYELKDLDKEHAGDDVPEDIKIGFDESLDMPEPRSTIDELKDRYENLDLASGSWERTARKRLTIQKLLGDAYVDQNDADSALGALQTALALEERLGEMVGQSETLLKIGTTLRWKGELLLARHCLEQSLAIRETVYGADSAELIPALHELVDVLKTLGDLSQAQALSERSLAISEKIDDSAVVTSLRVLAEILIALGNLSEARTRLEQALSIEESKSGEGHPEKASIFHGLGKVTAAQGDLSRAMAYFSRELVLLEEVHGTSKHPDIAEAHRALASVLRAAGDLDGAETKLELSVAILEEVFGEHPAVTVSLHDLAEVYEARGRLRDARDLLEKILTIEEKIYGTRGHYSTAITEVKLGTLLREEDPERARSLLEHAHTTFLGQLGPEHPLTRQSAQRFQESSEPNKANRD